MTALGRIVAIQLLSTGSVGAVAALWGFDLATGLLAGGGICALAATVGGRTLRQRATAGTDGAARRSPRAVLAEMYRGEVAKVVTAGGLLALAMTRLDGPAVAGLCLGYLFAQVAGSVAGSFGATATVAPAGPGTARSTAGTGLDI